MKCRRASAALDRPEPIRADGQCIHYEIVHRPRITRRIHLELSDRGNLQVVAPRRLSRYEIHRTLQRSADYVARFLADARARRASQPPLRYRDGERHLLLGKRYPLDVWRSEGARPRLEWMHDRIRLTFPRAPAVDAVRDLLLQGYRQRALAEFGDRLAAISAAAPWTGRRVPPMRLRRMKASWGTCSASGIITLNPLLLRAPPPCIDYVIAHEVCHLREHNHSDRFYALQETLFPDWPSARQQLNDNAYAYLQL